MWCRKRRKKKFIIIRRRKFGALAKVNNRAIGARNSSGGLINVNVPIAINLGDANAFNRSNGNTSLNIL